MKPKTAPRSKTKPLGLVPTQIFFSAPCGLMALSIHLLMPTLNKAGNPTLTANVLAYGIPIVALLGMAITAY